MEFRTAYIPCVLCGRKIGHLPFTWMLDGSTGRDLGLAHRQCPPMTEEQFHHLMIEREGSK